MIFRKEKGMEITGIQNQNFMLRGRNTATGDNKITDCLASNPFLVQQLQNPNTRKEVRERALAQKNGAIASGNSANFDIFSGLYELTNLLESSPMQDTFVSSAKEKKPEQGLSGALSNLGEDFLFA